MHVTVIRLDLYPKLFLAFTNRHVSVDSWWNKFLHHSCHTHYRTVYEENEAHAPIQQEAFTWAFVLSTEILFIFLLCRITSFAAFQQWDLNQLLSLIILELCHSAIHSY